MERGPGDVRHILASQRKLDRRAVGRAVSGLPNKPQDGTGNALFDPLGGTPRSRSCTSWRRLPMTRMTLIAIWGWRPIRTNSSASLQLASSEAVSVIASAGYRPSVNSATVPNISLGAMKRMTICAPSLPDWEMRMLPSIKAWARPASPWLKIRVSPRQAPHARRRQHVIERCGRKILKEL